MLQLLNVTAFAVLIKHIVWREVVFAALGAAERVTNLVLGAQVVFQGRLLLEHLVAQLTDELQTEQVVSYSSDTMTYNTGSYYVAMMGTKRSPWPTYGGFKVLLYDFRLSADQHACAFCWGSAAVSVTNLLELPHTLDICLCIGFYLRHVLVCVQVCG